MIRRRRPVVLTSMAGLLLAAVTPVLAATAATSSQPKSVFVLTATRGQTADPTTSKPVVLTCEPAGGTHPDPKTACQQLADVKGHFDQLNVDPKAICPLIFDPVTVTARGDWAGRLERFEKTFGNPCQLHAATGAVYAF